MKKIKKFEDLNNANFNRINMSDLATINGGEPPENHGPIITSVSGYLYNLLESEGFPMDWYTNDDPVM